MLKLRGAAIVKYTRRHNSRLDANGIRLALTAGYAARVPWCLLRGDKVLAWEHLAFINGMWFWTAQHGAVSGIRAEVP